MRGVRIVDLCRRHDRRTSNVQAQSGHEGRTEKRHGIRKGQDLVAIISIDEREDTSSESDFTS